MNTAALIAWVLSHLNYWVVLIFMAIESSFIPFPSEVVVPPAAWLSQANGELNIFLVVLVATLGADIGAVINYYLSKYLGRPVIYSFADSRFGHMCLITRDNVIKAEDYFRRHGAIATFLGRLVPGIRQLISIPAGLSSMRLTPFLLYTTLGAFIWNSVLAAIGYAIAKIPGVQTVDEVVELSTRYSHELGYTLLILAAAAIAFIIYKGAK